MSTQENQPNFQTKTSFSQKMRNRWKALKTDKPKVALALKLISGLFLSGILFAFALVLLVRFGAFGKLPSEKDLANISNHNASEVYSSDGVLLGKYYIENRTIIDYEDISPDIINALVATEDARFFEHSGIDFRSYVRVILKTVLMGDESGGGGSTLSQQLSKNLFPRKKHFILSIPINKLKEMFVARRLERLHSKDELLNLYLNTVPFGVNIYGVQVAAQQFFNTTARDLKTEEAAVLVGMLKANTYYNPVRNPNNALQRRNTVLTQMKKYDYIDATVCDSLMNLPIEVKYTKESHTDGIATYFREYLRHEVVKILKEHVKEDGTPYNLYTDGLVIHTTIDSRMQKYAEKAVKGHMKELQKSFDQHWKGQKPWGDDTVIVKEMKKSDRYKALKENGFSEKEIKNSFDKKQPMTVFTWEGEKTKEMSPLDSIKYYFCMLNAGFLAMEPGSGNIQAWVGGTNSKYFQYDHVRAKRQVGSIFKPIVYTKGLQSGYLPCDYFNNHLVTYTEYEDWQPQNADGKYGGVYSMGGALSKSVNSIAVDMNMRTGVEEVQKLAREMGVHSDIPKAPAIALGAVDLSLYEMLQVYGTYANRGLHVNPRYLTHIENNKGELIVNYEKDDKPTRVMSQDHADIMTKMMEMVVDSGTAKRLRFRYKLTNDIAGKTGTTQSHADGWFLGFTPNLVVGSWVGGDSPRIRFRSLSLGQGANTALPICGRFMSDVMKDSNFKKLSYASFPDPSIEVLEAMNCPGFHEEKPPIAEEEGGFNQQLDNLLESLKLKKEEKDKAKNSPAEARQKKKQRKESKESERIRKKNEKARKKRERKKKRKKKWDKIFNNN